jgi:PIN domain nuclease of toxin-antitoxin system
MRILIDSHIFVWWALRSPIDRHITREERRVLEDPTNDLLLSTATAWELALKMDRLGLTNGFEPLIHAAIRELRLTILGVELRHIIYSGSLPWHHRDPFDRILISQALLEGVPILTQDRKIAQYAVPIIH